MTDSSRKAEAATSSAEPHVTRDPAATSFKAAGGSRGNNSADFDSVILDLNADENDEAAQGRPEPSPPSSSSVRSSPAQEGGTTSHADHPVPADLVETAGLDQIGPEHFRRTLIAPARNTIPAGERRATPRGVKVTPYAVDAKLEDPRLLMVHEPDSPRAASLRVLRHRLAERGDPRTIVVTSPEIGDGKTMCAANLAIALSECGRARVLLFEANFRRPALTDVLGIRPPVCLTRQMAEHHQNPDPPPWAAAQLISPWLHVLAIDTATFRGPRMIDGPAFENTIAQLRLVGYDYIVIDTPAVLGNADVNLVQDVADGVLLALTAKRSSTRALRTALDQLTTAKVIGTALFDAV